MLEQAVLISFHAPWCAPCKAMAPIVKEIISTSGLKLVDVDVDEDVELAIEYKVRAIPTLILVKDNHEVGRLIGSQSAEQLKKFIHR